jgi:ABC-type antimicrobial peptide transport system permease subunit
MAARVGQYRAVPKFYTIIAAIFALTSLALALGGVYGSMLYAVGQRTREFGIRMALGARAARVTRMVLRNGLAIGGIGLAVGLAGAVALSRIMESVLFGVTPTDPITYVAVGTVVLGAASVASLVPALKASRADPMTTLRTE